jgi:tetratricopeptide (TPR) repeat protein
VIERLLAAERALAEGDLNQAERLFGQVAQADARNAMAVVGLGQVALARGDPVAARGLAERALAIDPDDAAAARLAEAPPLAASAAPVVATSAEVPSAAQPAEAPPAAQPPAAELEPTGAPASRPSLLARLRAWLWALVGRRA